MSSTLIANTGLNHPTDLFTRGPSYVNLTLLGASSANNLTIPAGVQYVRLSGNADFYVKWGSTGVSTAAAVDGTASELISLQSGGILRSIGSTLGTTAISAMSTAACVMTQSWWTI